jgi:hypothetical protein
VKEMTTNQNLDRVYFQLDSTDWHGRPNEGLWAEPLEAATPGTAYRLKNSPFFARDVSFLDTVRVAPRDDGGPGLAFAGVIDRGGHSTYMILVPPDFSEFDSYWERLEKLGCTYESTTIKLRPGTRVLYSVDVPDSTDIYAVYSILEEGEKYNVWIFQEGHVGHKLKTE